MIAVVITVSAAWASYRPEQTTFIIGFATMICTALFTSMRQEIIAAETAIKVNEVKQDLQLREVKTEERIESVVRTMDSNLDQLNDNMRRSLTNVLANVTELTALAKEIARLDPTDTNKERVALWAERIQLSKDAIRQHDERLAQLAEMKRSIRDSAKSAAPPQKEERK